MSVQPLSEDQRDALQEVTNIAMGQAGSSLAKLLDTFVNLSVPRIRLVEVTQLPEMLSGMVGKDTIITAVRQSFQGFIRGEAIVIYDQNGCSDLADLMGYDDEIDAAEEKELLLDVANVLTGACLCGIAEQLKSDLTFSAPSLMAEQINIDRLITPENMTWSHALLVEVNFKLEAKGFTCHLTMLMPEESIERLRESLDRFLEMF